MPITFHCVLSQYTFHVCLFYPLSSNANALNQSTHLFFRKSLAIRQLNIQAATTENDEQCTLSNAMYINFQNCYFLIWGPL